MEIVCSMDPTVQRRRPGIKPFKCMIQCIVGNPTGAQLSADADGLTRLRIYLRQTRNILEAGHLGSPKTYEQLVADVEVEGMATYPMGVLRDIEGAGKLGVHIRKKISQELRARGADHLPEELPAYQDELVRIFKRGSPLDRLIRAVLEPTPEGDSVLRSIVNDDAREKIEQIERILAS